MAAIIVTGVFRYGEMGEKAADLNVEVPIDYEKDAKEGGDRFTYADHGSMIQGLFISACVLFCGFNCFAGMMTQVSKQLIAYKK